MFIVFLRFTENKPRAASFMPGHKEWIDRGFADEVFLVVGSLEQSRGGAVIATNTTREALEQRVSADPFVIENIVDAEIIEITPSRTDERLKSLIS
jgi:uncharacterized protein YciI